MHKGICIHNLKFSGNVTAYLDGITSEFYPKFKEKVMAML